jgi:hypothetical protein
VTRLERLVRLKGIPLSSIARSAGVHKFDISHYLHRRYHKISRKNRKLIRNYFRSQGWLPTPKLQPKHECPICHKMHAQNKHIHKDSQLESVKNSFTSTI